MFHVGGGIKGFGEQTKRGEGRKIFGNLTGRRASVCGGVWLRIVREYGANRSDRREMRVIMSHIGRSLAEREFAQSVALRMTEHVGRGGRAS